MRVGEAALHLVELEGRHTEVEQDAVDARNAEVVEHQRQLVVHRVHEVDPALERGEPRPCERQGFWIAVDPDESKVGESLQHRLAVTAESERRVDDNRTRSIDRRREQRDASLEQHGHVLRRLSGHGGGGHCSAESSHEVADENEKAAGQDRRAEQHRDGTGDGTSESLGTTRSGLSRGVAQGKCHGDAVLLARGRSRWGLRRSRSSTGSSSSGRAQIRAGFVGPGPPSVTRGGYRLAPGKVRQVDR